MLEEVDRNTEAQLTKRIPDDNLRIFIKQVFKIFSQSAFLLALLINFFIIQFKTTREMTAKCWGVIISHPFHGNFKITSL